MSSSSEQALEILERLKEQVPADQVRTHHYLKALGEHLAQSDRALALAKEELEQYAEAYEKLTSPANRIGFFVKWLEPGHTAMVALGETDYIVKVDPKIDADSLKLGACVRLNEAYAIIGILPQPEGGNIAKVGELLPPDRIKLGGQSAAETSRVVYLVPPLDAESVKTGDFVRLDPSSRFAFEILQREETRDYFFEDVPEIPWSKVGGQEKAIELIRETIEHPLLHPEIYQRFEKKPIKGILLYGPPGCGKTLIGKATAYNLTQEYSRRVGHEVKEYFMYISGPKILNMWLGETERMVREIFEVARKKAKEGRLVFIFMDEAESVLRTRSSGRLLNISNTVVPQFCAELDGLVQLENVVLMLTSNRPDYIDPAVLRPERIDRKIKINRPSESATREILSIYLKSTLPLDPELVAKHHGCLECAQQELLDHLTKYLWSTQKDTEFLKVHLRNASTETLHWKDLISGALLKSIVDRAKEYAIKRNIAVPDAAHGITKVDLELAAQQEFVENEIFPKSEIQEDWLKLLDYDPENVVQVRPVKQKTAPRRLRNPVI